MKSVNYFIFGILIVLLLTISLLSIQHPVQAQGSLTASPTQTALVSPSPSPSATNTSNADASTSLVPNEGIVTEKAPATLTPTLAFTPTDTSPPAVIPLIVHEPTPVGYGPDAFPININPLTGLVVEDPQILNRRPLVIKVTNYPRTVRPQSGLSRADIVYEYYQERGVSRFIAIFYGSDVPRVGPVRSGRFFDAHIFQMYDGFFIFGYADERIFDFFDTLGDYWLRSFILDTGLREINCSPEIARFLCRDVSLITYNNLFANTAELTKIGESRDLQHRVDLNGMRFTQRTPTGGELALEVRVRFSLFIYTKWVYNVTLGRYQRFEEVIGDSNPNFEEYAPHMDALTGEQIAADNIVVLYAPYYYFVLTNTTEITNIPLYGEGPAYVFRDGYAFPAKWSRPTLEQGVLQILTLDDEPFALKPGNTWIEVLSSDSRLSSNTTDWRFVFQLPDNEGGIVNPNSENAPFGIYQDEIFEIMGVTATPTPDKDE